MLQECVANEIDEAIEEILSLQLQLRKRSISPSQRRDTRDLHHYWRFRLAALLREKCRETVRRIRSN